MYALSLPWVGWDERRSRTWLADGTLLAFDLPARIRGERSRRRVRRATAGPRHGGRRSPGATQRVRGRLRWRASALSRLRWQRRAARVARGRRRHGVDLSRVRRG